MTDWETRLGEIADDLWQRGDKATSSALHDLRRMIQQAPVPSRLTARSTLENAARMGVRAMHDPGAFVKRGRDPEGWGGYERLDRWQERALQVALDRIEAAEAETDAMLREKGLVP